ncbi:hypothetical protein D3C78_1122440 [compost metagenome]
MSLRNSFHDFSRVFFRMLFFLVRRHIEYKTDDQVIPVLLNCLKIRTFVRFFIQHEYPFAIFTFLVIVLLYRCVH